MNRIVIIGSSAAGHTLALGLRAKKAQCAITLVTEEKFPAYDRRKLAGYFAGRVKEKELFLCVADAYAKEEIAFIKEAKVVGVNAERRTVYMKFDEKRDSIGYDTLVVCSGTKISLPELPGIQKEGVFAFNGLADMKAAKSIVISGPVCFFGGWDSRAAELAAVLHAEKKEVVYFGEAPAGGIAGGVQVVDSRVAEMIGESGLQAVKLQEGKIIGTSFVICAGPRLASTEFLKDAGVALENGFITVDGAGRSSKDRIYACGAVTGKSDSWEDAVKQAEALTDTLAAIAAK